MPDTDDAFRSDALVQKAGERQMDQFKYLSAVSWAPVVIVLAFYRSRSTETPLIMTSIISIIIVMLIISGSIFFLTYVKQNQMLIHRLMGDYAIDRASEVNPNAKAEISMNIVAAHRLGHISNNIAFPLLVLGYVGIAFCAVISLWI